MVIALSVLVNVLGCIFCKSNEVFVMWAFSSATGCPLFAKEPEQNVSVFVYRSVYKLLGLRVSEMLSNLIEDFWELFLDILTSPISQSPYLPNITLATWPKKISLCGRWAAVRIFLLLFSLSVFLVASSSVAIILGYTNKTYYKSAISLWPELYRLQFMGKCYYVMEPSLFLFASFFCFSLCLLSLGLILGLFFFPFWETAAHENQRDCAEDNERACVICLTNNLKSWDLWNYRSHGVLF